MRVSKELSPISVHNLCCDMKGVILPNSFQVYTKPLKPVAKLNLQSRNTSNYHLSEDNLKIALMFLPQNG